MIEPHALQRFENLIRVRSGLNMRAQEEHLLRKTLNARMQTLRFSAPAHYLELLDSNSVDAQNEWKHLFRLLTNQESYFFRDSGQLQVIREQILPDLIRRRRDARTLRIWSAGCSTGEEPYSLAMMLEDALPAREDWRILILGTDLSESAVEHARRGLYGAWSFRTRDSDVQQRFFVPQGNKWEVKPGLRRFVQLAQGNLLGDEFPTQASEMHDMDLIVCRNVFIYFARDAVTRVLRKFTATLHADGYLVTGHAELHDIPLDGLITRVFPQTVVYQPTNSALPGVAKDLSRKKFPDLTPASPLAPSPLAPSLQSHPPRIASTPSSVPPVGAPRPKTAPALLFSTARGPSPTLALNPSPAPLASSTLETVDFNRIIEMIRSGGHAFALEQLQLLLKREPQNLAALCLAAQARANAGQLEEAEALCRRAIEASLFAPLPYHILARIAAERGDNEGAKTLLKKVIYLNPSSVWSYLELVALYAREGDAKRAGQMQRSALEILEGLSEDVPVPAEEFSVEERLTVCQLKRHLQSNVDE